MRFKRASEEGGHALGWRTTVARTGRPPPAVAATTVATVDHDSVAKAATAATASTATVTTVPAAFKNAATLLMPLRDVGRSLLSPAALGWERLFSAVRGRADSLRRLGVKHFVIWAMSDMAGIWMSQSSLSLSLSISLSLSCSLTCALSQSVLAPCEGSCRGKHERRDEDSFALLCFRLDGPTRVNIDK